VRRWLPQLAARRRVTVLMILMTVMVVGALATRLIPVQMLPSGFSENWLWLQIPYYDASPQEVDEAIVGPVYSELSSVEGIERIRSRAGSYGAGFFIQLEGTTDSSVAYNSVVDRVERALVNLPDDVEDYRVYKYDPNDTPIAWIGVELPEDIEDPHWVISEVLQPRLERIPGVANVNFWGTGESLVAIEYDQERIMAHGIDLRELQARLAADNFQMPAGEVVDGGRSLLLRSQSRFAGIETIQQIPVAQGLVLSDIATVGWKRQGEDESWRINGANAITLGIFKESQANTLEVDEQIQQAFRALEADKRFSGLRFHTFFSQGELLREGMAHLLNTALIGSFFAIIVLWIFLRDLRATLLIALSIPLSVYIAVTILYFRGESLNLLSLMGLMLAVGMVVDNAIVVVESILRQSALSDNPAQAAVDGTAEVNLAIVTSTATTMVVFLPLMLMNNNVGFALFMKGLGFPVIFSLAASLLVGVVFSPWGAVYLRAGVKPQLRWIVRLRESYLRLLERSLRHRGDAMMGILAFVVLTVAVPVRGVNCQQTHDNPLGEVSADFSLPPHISPLRKQEVLEVFEQWAAEHQQQWHVRAYVGRLGEDDGEITFFLDSQGRKNIKAIVDEMRQDLPVVTGVVASVGHERNDDDHRMLYFNFYGQDIKVLDEVGEEIARRAEGLEGVVRVLREQDQHEASEVRLQIDRDATNRYGVSASQVAQTVAYAIRGIRLPPLWDGDIPRTVIARFGLDDRSDFERIRRFPVWSGQTRQLVPVSALSDVEFGHGPWNIRRSNGKTNAEVIVEMDEDMERDELRKQIDSLIKNMVLPEGVSWEGGGYEREEREDQQALLFGMLSSMVFVFLLMGMLFESFTLPIAMIATVPLALIGSAWTLYLTKTPFDTMAGVGLVLLVGVVVNNGIVLLDVVGQLRREGRDRNEALIEAGRRRMRPIVMTALTTICGLLPMAVGGSHLVGIPYAPLARTVIGGLLVSTVLTLVFVPLLYTFLDDLKLVAGRWLSRVVG